MKEMFYTTYLKKRYYRIIESLIKKVLRFKNNSKNNTLKKTIQSAIYYTTDKNKILFLSNNRQENWKDLLVQCTNENIHIMNKRSIDRHADRLMELYYGG